jgi:hypothetical protein
MAKLTVGFGVLLFLLGVWAFVRTGDAQHSTALVPGWIGLLFVLLGELANTADSKRRVRWMHIAATLALLGFLAMMRGMVRELRMLRGTFYLYPIAIEEKAMMGLLCLVYVGLCVRSFVAARRTSRQAAS